MVFSTHFNFWNLDFSGCLSCFHTLFIMKHFSLQSLLGAQLHSLDASKRLFNFDHLFYFIDLVHNDLILGGFAMIRIWTLCSVTHEKGYQVQGAHIAQRLVHVRLGEQLTEIVLGFRILGFQVYALRVLHPGQILLGRNFMFVGHLVTTKRGCCLAASETWGRGRLVLRGLQGVLAVVFFG